MPGLATVQRPISALPIAAKIAIPDTAGHQSVPDWVAIGPDAVWISNQGTDSLVRVDPATNQIAKVVPVGRRPCSGTAVGFGAVWSPSCRDNRVDRVNPQTNQLEATIATNIGNSEGGIAAGAGGVWVIADTQGRLVRIDPASNTLSGKANLPAGSFVPVVGAGSVWISSISQNLVTRVRPADMTIIAQILVGPSPRFMAASDQDVWVLNQGNGTVSRIDASTNQVVATIDAAVPGTRGDIAIGEGFVWVTMINIPLTQIDPATNRVIVQYVGTGGDALRVSHGPVWLCSFFLKELWRVPLPL